MNTHQMISVIQIYIHLVKGVEVNIVPRIPQELPLLFEAYNNAKEFIDNNKIKIILLK